MVSDKHLSSSAKRHQCVISRHDLMRKCVRPCVVENLEAAQRKRGGCHGNRWDGRVQGVGVGGQEGGWEGRTGEVEVREG